mmetsp:Transcript_14763/g.31654  ORF Transcript_14763/g.31654 Transcript_14763/m.31654 type:complete len:341 (-) Transcript_14763:282-1304(-)|eukprot:CAMPEP_0185853788 /NCGR_PEP_ID=MMETSP1354-20130828/20194_1 /TAXON_ID=708628 /ORGANISM="Erythrolobus madagascarensis, Strain CCMP3276" /LENGTH=340 /DNA_ID=CAMNT_0028555379 /DNA_START=144 /DNA_END=1166 /DNA_ORIENTATION=+
MVLFKRGISLLGFAFIAVLPFVQCDFVPSVPEPTCIKNATHCSCVEKSYRSLIPSAFESGRCTLDVERTGAVCSCPGSSLCERDVEPCGSNKLRAVGAFDVDGTVDCEELEGGDCERASEPQHCSAAVNVFVDGKLGGCVSTIPVMSDVDDAYGYSSWRANNIENVEYDMINLRFIETRANNELHFCVIYGNWRVGELEKPYEEEASRLEKAEITAAFPLYFEIKDDPSDVYEGEGTTKVNTAHAHYATKSDGYCLGPLLGDGSGVRAKFYDLNNILGVNVQTFNPATFGTSNLFKWDFADYRNGDDLKPDGRSDGDESVVVDFQPTCECAADDEITGFR